MSDLEHLSQPLPVDNSIIIKLPEKTNIFFNGFSIFKASNSPLYISTKDFVDKVAGLIFEQVQPPEVYQQGTKVEILEPEKKWVSGKFRLRLVFEFISDEPENNTPDKFVSPLDDIRNMNA